MGGGAHLLCEGAAAALCKEGRLGAQLHPALERVLGRAVLGHADIVRRDAHDLARVIIEHLDSCGG
eukprot:6006288-Prymnesium_polylepis.1